MDAGSGIVDVDRFSTIVPMSPLVACLPIHVPSLTTINRPGHENAELRTISDEMSKEIAGLLSRADCSHIQMRVGYVLRDVVCASLLDVVHNKKSTIQLFQGNQKAGLQF
jgi:hypothetical protein